MTGGSGSAKSGGSLLLTSGHGSATSSGNVRFKTSNAGTAGVSGLLSFSSGTSSNGTSGSISVGTGAATGGKGGSISFAVGQGNSANGGAVKMTAGETTANGVTGGALDIRGGLASGTTASKARDEVVAVAALARLSELGGKEGASAIAELRKIATAGSPPAKKSGPPATAGSPPAKKSAPPAKKSGPPATKGGPPATKAGPPATTAGQAQERAIRALVVAKDASVASVLRGDLTSKDAKRRTLAAARLVVLSQAAQSPINPALTLLADKDPEVRGNVACAVMSSPLALRVARRINEPAKSSQQTAGKLKP